MAVHHEDAEFLRMARIASGGGFPKRSIDRGDGLSGRSREDTLAVEGASLDVNA